MIDHIQIRGARVHNLKNVDVDVPLNQIVALPGSPAPGSPRWRWAYCMPKAPGGIWNPCPPIPGGA